MNIIDRIKELVEALNYHRNLYYNESRPEISDFEYDRLFDELSKLEKETGIVMSTSPTVTVGYEVKSSLNKVKHNHPMLSLDRTKSVDDVIKFLNGRDGVVMAKMDGLTCSIRYINGEKEYSDVKKYPINELHHLRYCLHTAAVDGVRKHPAKEIEDLGLEILAFDGCPPIECDFALVRAEKLPPLPRYIEDISIDKDGKNTIKKWFPEFVLEE